MTFPWVGALALLVFMILVLSVRRRGPSVKQVLAAVVVIAAILAILVMMSAAAGGWAG